MEFTDMKWDSRGVIVKYKEGNVTNLIICTKKGSLRAGETHNVDQITILWKGKIEVILKLEPVT